MGTRSVVILTAALVSGLWVPAGAQTLSQTDAAINQGNLPQPVGVLVQRVAERSPALLIGLRGGSMKATIEGKALTAGGDIILAVQGIPIEDRRSYERIQERLSRLHPGAEITITVLREGRQVELGGPLP